jgi:hypothetical protein
VKRVAVSIFALVVVVAVGAGVSIYTFGFRSTQPSYSGYEPVLREWYALSRYDAAKIKHLHGPFYAIRYRSRSHRGKQYCVLVDVSTRYKGWARPLLGDNRPVSRGRNEYLRLLAVG